MTDTQDLKRYKYGYFSDEWGMGLSMSLIPDPAGNVCLFAEAAEKLKAAQAEIERLTTENHALGDKAYQATHRADALQVTNDTLKHMKAAALARLAELEKQEPVMVYDGRCIWDCGDGGHQDVTMLKMIAKGTKLFAAAGASPEPSALQAENAKLITALAECRDAFPVPDAGSRLDDWYCTAMADPLQVPEYVKACVGASPVQPNQGLQSVADALTIEQLNDKVERLMAVQPSQDADHNAPWLTEAHMLCTDQGVPQGNISWRIQVLRELLAQPSQAGEPTEAQLVAGVKAMRLFVTKNSVKDFREGFIAAINAKGAQS